VSVVSAQGEVRKGKGRTHPHVPEDMIAASDCVVAIEVEKELGYTESGDVSQCKV
jgi:hypothetical protein